MDSNFISNLQKKRCNYNHPDQATCQANSLILLSSGIYTEEERLVFELLQNAVDAHNEESKTLDIKMIIKDGYFIFLHNGKAFTERDIEGLCDVGNGSKMKDVKKIGYKGIGFKSVFMRSTNVTFQSCSYCFKFDKSYWDNYWDEHWSVSDFGARDTEKKYLMPWQIIPIETTPPISLSNYEYNVATYIKINGTDTLEQKILKLLSSSQFLLFLMCDNIRMTSRIQLASANLQHLFVKALIRSCEIEFFPWSCVNFLHNLSYLLLTDVRKASILWNVLPNEPIYILNSPFLP